MRFADGPPGFVPLDPTKPIRKYSRHLPHWSQTGATYFATFHLADSLPVEKLFELKQIRDSWERSNPEPRGENAWSELNRLTMTRIGAWLDEGHGFCGLREGTAARTVGNAFHHFHDRRYVLHAWCVMPNHAHVLFRTLADHEPEEILKSWKGFTARELNKRIGRKGKLWHEESYDTLIRDAAHLAKAVRYIGHNPAKACLPRENWYRWVDPDWQRLGWGFDEEENDDLVREESLVGDFPV